MIAADLIVRTGRDIGSAIENAAFQVTTLISTTGYCTEDFDLWPQFCRCILVLVMFFGGCAGSTAGGVKASRIVLLCKSLRRDLRRVMHSREVRPITLDGRDSRAWIERTQCDKLNAWAALPGAEFSLVVRGQARTVLFLEFTADPISRLEDSEIDDQTVYVPLFKFLEV